MDYIEKISGQYDGRILLHAPYKGKKDGNIPEELYSILCISNGILETMCLSDTEEPIVIGWIVYPHDMILEQTAFYTENYGIKGTIFSDDGAGCPYIIKNDRSITSFIGIVDEEYKIADTLSDFFQ